MDPRERAEETVKWVKKERKEAKVIQDQGRATNPEFFPFFSFHNFQSVLALIVPEAKRRKLYMARGVIDLIQIPIVILNHLKRLVTRPFRV